MKRRKKHLCGGCDRLVILYLQIANYSSDWLLSDQFACAVMVTGLQIRHRISCGSDVAFWSPVLGANWKQEAKFADEGFTATDYD